MSHAAEYVVVGRADVRRIWWMWNHIPSQLLQFFSGQSCYMWSCIIMKQQWSFPDNGSEVVVVMQFLIGSFQNVAVCLCINHTMLGNRLAVYESGNAPEDDDHHISGVD